MVAIFGRPLTANLRSRSAAAMQFTIFAAKRELEGLACPVWGTLLFTNDAVCVPQRAIAVYGAGLSMIERISLWSRS